MESTKTIQRRKCSRGGNLKTEPQEHFHLLPNSLSSTLILFLNWKIPQFSEGVTTKAAIMNASFARQKMNWISSEKIHPTDHGK